MQEVALRASRARRFGPSLRGKESLCAPGVGVARRSGTACRTRPCARRAAPRKVSFSRYFSPRGHSEPPPWKKMKEIDKQSKSICLSMRCEDAIRILPLNFLLKRSSTERFPGALKPHMCTGPGAPAPLRRGARKDARARAIRARCKESHKRGGLEPPETG